MMEKRYLRNTHDENGRWHPFPREAMRVWWGETAVVGPVLRLETPLTLAEIMAECEAVALAHPEGMPYPEADEAYVADLLDKLVGWGMVIVV